MNFMSYVVYEDDGSLIGGFLQDNIPEVHRGRVIFVDDYVRLHWPFFRANEARDGVELIPAEDRPVDPDPEPPVQSGN